MKDNMKKIITIFVFLALMGLVAGQSEVEPQIIDAENPLYPLDVASDNALMSVGLRSEGEVAHERASEMYLARNNPEAYENAERELERVTERATERNRNGLEKAQRVLDEISQKTNAPGVDTAINNVRNAKRRKLEDLPK